MANFDIEAEAIKLNGCHSSGCGTPGCDVLCREGRHRIANALRRARAAGREDCVLALREARREVPHTIRPIMLPGMTRALRVLTALPIDDEVSE